MEKNVYIVSSPLQMISAVSAVKRNVGEQNILVLKLEKVNCKNEEQINSLVNETIGLWSDKILYTHSSNSLVAFFKSFFFILSMTIKFKGALEKLYFGEFRSQVIHVLRRKLKAKHDFLLDDGAVTIYVQNCFLSKSIDYYIGDGKLNSLRQYFYRLFFNIDIRSSRTLNLSSFFDFKHNMLPQQRNDHPPSKKSAVSLNLNQVYFFGGAYSENRICSLNDELSIINHLNDLFSDKKLFYIPHRFDSKEKLLEVKNLGLNVKELGVPAEIYFEGKNVFPEVMLGCWSTVLYSSFTKLENVKTFFFDMQPFIVNDNAKKRAYEIYNYYKDIGMESVV